MRRARVWAWLVALVGLVGGSVIVAPASAEAELSVAAALAAQDGRAAPVAGFVVGQPVSAGSVLRSGFTGDTAIAIADSAGETGTAGMLYVQVTSAYRAAFGLRTNPGLMGRRIVVAGQLTAYFSHGGLQDPTSMTADGTAGDDYYAAAAGKSGSALRAALNGIVRNQTKLSYSQVWTALRQTDEDPSNASNVVLLYSGRSQSKTSNGGNADDWNREHVWPQSHGDFGTAAGPGTDLR